MPGKLEKNLHIKKIKSLHNSKVYASYEVVGMKIGKKTIQIIGEKLSEKKNPMKIISYKIGTTFFKKLWWAITVK